MIFIGIDFSLNSTGICIFDGENYKFISIYNSTKNQTVSKKLIGDMVGVCLVPFAREATTQPTYNLTEQAKMIDAKALADTICYHIWEQTVGHNDITINLEGLAYASKGRSAQDLAMYQGFLRSSLITMFGVENINIVAPTEVKRHACKGGATKSDMLNAFVGSNDPQLTKHPLWAWAAKHKDHLDGKNLKPLEDLVDAYWLANIYDAL